jgi:hypothetical protein
VFILHRFHCIMIRQIWGKAVEEWIKSLWNVTKWKFIGSTNVRHTSTIIDSSCICTNVRHTSTIKDSSCICTNARHTSTIIGSSCICTNARHSSTIHCSDLSLMISRSRSTSLNVDDWRKQANYTNPYISFLINKSMF